MADGKPAERDEERQRVEEKKGKRETVCGERNGKGYGVKEERKRVI